MSALVFLRQHLKLKSGNSETVRLLCSHNSEAEKLYQIITSSPNPQHLHKTLKSTNMFLTNDLLDTILKRFRFSHGNPLHALHLFNYASRSRNFFHSSYSLDTLLYILGRSRHFSLIWDVLNDVRRKDANIVTPRTIMVVLGRVAKVCSVKQTVETFKKFKRVVPVFDTACFNALFRTLCQEKSMADARNVYRDMRGRFRPDIQTFNVLLSGWKSVEDAEGFFKEMKELRVAPDIVSYNCLVDVYCKGRMVDEAFKVVERMRVDRIEPDVITYTSIIGGLGLVGQPDKGREVLKEMKEFGCYPDVAAYNAVMRNYCIAKRVGDAYSVMDEMIGKGMSPNATTYNPFFRVFSWWNDLGSAWGLYNRMMDGGVLPNTQSCMFLMRLFKRQEKVDMALRLWNDMVEKGFGSYVLVSDVLFDLLCDLGKLVEAERCFMQMVEKGFKPSSVSFRRIKVLMELANKHDSIQILSEKMAVFGHSIQLRGSEKSPDEMTLLDTTPC